MAEAESGAHRTRVAATARRLAIDGATAEVVRAWSAAGVEGLLLKGASLTGWLYPPQEATYMDVDLLVHPGDEEPAAAALLALGFRPSFDERSMPAWWREHATEWQRPDDLVSVDLHRKLVGIGADPRAAWELLAGECEAVPVGGIEAPALGRRARLVHLALHAAQHGARWGKAIAHVDRALAVVDEALWQDAAALAAQLDATDALAAGLRLASGGEALADRLGLPPVGSVDVALRSGTTPPVALGFERLALADGVRARAAILWRKTVPPREFIVYWEPSAARSRWHLLRAYAHRPLWLLRRSPAGLHAWLLARRRTRRLAASGDC